VLDDFEHNLEPRNDEYVLKPEAANVLNAIVWAIKESYSFHRIIITCRYDFDFTDSQYFYKQPLDALRGADLQKKWKRLTASDNIDETLRSQVEKLADGNHRFLEKLYDELNKSSEFKKLKELNKSKENSKKLKELQLLIYNYLKAEREELLREVLEDKLSKQIKEDSLMSQMLQRGLVFELPVPREAVEAICKTIPNWDDDYINKAIALGLLEVSHDQSLRVPRYLVLEKLDEISLNKIAAKKLYQLWYEEPGNPEKVPEERLLEIHRLAQLVNEIEIEAEITEKLATRWNFRKSQCQKLIKLCTSLLERLERSNLLEYNYVSKIQNVLGSSYLFQGRYRESEYLKNKVLENISDKDPLILAEILDDLGYISTYLKDYETAKSRLDEAFKIRQEEHQLDHIDLVKSRSNLAYWHREKGKWNEAEDCYKKALEMCERIQENEEEEEGIFLAEIYHDLGAVYYEQALDIKTAHDNDNKESSIKTTEDKVQEQELYKKAEKHYSQALNQSRTLINKSLSVATFLSSLAKVLCCQKKDEEAQEQFKKALDIRKGLLGMHLEIVADLKNLGFINSRLGNYKEAEIYFIEALKLMKNLIESKDNSVFGNQERAFKHVEEIVNALKLEPTCSIFIIIAIRPTITCRICMLITVNYESV
jgi:tetratricopeptide (TPR) repeat protein